MKNIYVFIGTSKVNKSKGYYYANIYFVNEYTSIYSDVFESSSLIDEYYINLKAIADITKKITKITKKNNIIFYVSNYDLALDYKDKNYSQYSALWTEIKKLPIVIKYKDDFAKTVDRVARCKQ